MRLLILAISVLSPNAPAADWPQWRGPNRDGKADFKVPATWPKELTKKWQVVVGDGVRKANGSGKLSATSGAGTWSGGGGICSGSWVAERN